MAANSPKHVTPSSDYGWLIVHRRALEHHETEQTKLPQFVLRSDKFRRRTRRYRNKDQPTLQVCGYSEAFGAGDIVPSFNAGYWADRNPIRSYMYVDQGPALFST